MSELINNSFERKNRLKDLILKLHHGESQENVKSELMESLRSIPYGEVVEVEQELIAEGLPEEEVLKLCDVHSAVLQGSIDTSAMKITLPGHPADVFIKENIEIQKVCNEIKSIFISLNDLDASFNEGIILKLRQLFNNLFDVDKHYRRKEYLLFPFLEKSGITGPPKVMWGKHDEIRDLLKGSIEILQTPDLTKEDLHASAEIILLPAVNQTSDMIQKEEQILLPMSMDKLTEEQWYEIHTQSLEFGFCLYDPPVDWKPKWAKSLSKDEAQMSGNFVQLHTGSFTVDELTAILNTLPVDMTFVDKDDKVKYFSQSKDRIFQRNRAILNRDVRYCHPPGSVHIVDKIIEDFRSGKESRAPFWINMGGKFIHIEYFAIRSNEGEYLGTLEVSQDLSIYRTLEGEQRLLSYIK